MMMAKIEEGSSHIMDGLFGGDDELDEVYIDLDSFWEVMQEPPASSEYCREEPVSMPTIGGLGDRDEPTSSNTEFVGFCAPSPSYNSGVSDSKTGGSDIFSDSAGDSVFVEGERLEPSSQFSSAEQSCFIGANDCINVLDGGYQSASSYGQICGRKALIETPSPDDTIGYQSVSSYGQIAGRKALIGIPSPNDTYGFNLPNHVIPDREFSEFCHQKLEEGLFDSFGRDACSKNVHDKQSVRETNIGSSITPGIRASPETSHAESNSFKFSRDIPDLFSENGGADFFSSDCPHHFSSSSEFKSLAVNDVKILNIVDGGSYNAESYVGVVPRQDLVGDQFVQCNGNYAIGTSVYADGQDGVAQSRHMDQFDVLGDARADVNRETKIEPIVSDDIAYRASGLIDDVMNRRYFGGASQLPVGESMQWSSSNSSSSISYNNYVYRRKDYEEDIFFETQNSVAFGETPVISSSFAAQDQQPALQASGRLDILATPSLKTDLNCLKTETEVLKFNVDHSSTNCIVFGGTTGEQSNVDDDSDLCILEDMSAPGPARIYTKSATASQISNSRAPTDQKAIGHSKLKLNDEQVIFRVALQDLSQPKSEAIPPMGLLAVPLLRHQRIALSWMINKETKNACCAGGILADDQGLGKTVSTISLILKERSFSKAPTSHGEQNQMEMLNLDEDESGCIETESLDGGAQTRQINQCAIDGDKVCSLMKGRPAGGTLIVCPTSVLRQWSEELHNKVTSEADLSVLVYHGSNRTKDPTVLAKYDVVVTTYAIVSMEVPKQPPVDEEDPTGIPSKGYSYSKKRKQVGNMPEKKSSTSKKSKKGVDGELVESISGPLARVGWFRIVLDEAQIIKNHRTQVARACWALRAKRRWCLSGTPIQNAIDDLYSYFRFLRYEPYASYKNFCEQLKAPIHWHPRDGYKKLQAVLKTIMLRRTKSTVIDGEPIINLPPKTIELKEVDFSKEERDFYSNLEADSRAKFAVYAREGTVKQNYVNILLMLLRLRQACDHPLLVRGYNSYSQVTSSLEMAKKLPREKQSCLLSCLEARLAICGICNDAPEDAVVTVCGHVFCNQCICEHMIGDSTECPIKNCKTHITVSYLFSIPTLRIALSGQLSIENIPDSCDSELSQVSEPCPSNCLRESSKIKAALELLLSLSKPRVCASKSSPDVPSEDYSSQKPQAGISVGDNGITFMNGHSNNSVRVVGEKAIVFSQWTRMLDLLEDCLKSSSIQYRRLDGTMPVVARDRAVKDFNSLPEVSVMIMSLKAASLGLNMVAACHVLLLDLWWNPTTEDQAIDRAHRIGQTRPVSVFRLTVKDTVEDRILALQQKKREMVASAFGEDEAGGRQTRLTVEDLKYLFRV